MTFPKIDARIASLEEKRKTKLNFGTGERRSVIHRLGSGLLHTCIVHRMGTYSGGQV